MAGTFYPMSTNVGLVSISDTINYMAIWRTPWPPCVCFLESPTYILGPFFLLSYKEYSGGMTKRRILQKGWVIIWRFCYQQGYLVFVRTVLTGKIIFCFKVIMHLIVETQRVKAFMRKWVRQLTAETQISSKTKKSMSKTNIKFSPHVRKTNIWTPSLVSLFPLFFLDDKPCLKLHRPFQN